MPMISVILAEYNAEEDLLHRAVDSVLNQSYKDFELIIVDNCSTSDETMRVLEEYKKNPYIRVIRNEKNQGVAFSRNVGIRNSKGEWIAFLEHDDYYGVDYLKNFVDGMESLEKEGKISDMIVMGYTEIDDADNVTGKFPKEKEFFDSEWMIWSCGIVWNRIYRREAVLQHDIWFSLGCYTEDMLFVLLCNEKLLNPQVIASYEYYKLMRKNSLSHSEAFSRADLSKLPIEQLSFAALKKNRGDTTHHATGFIYNEVTQMCCLLTRNSDKEVQRETRRLVRELLRNGFEGKSGALGDTVAYVKGAQIDSMMKALILGMHLSMILHADGLYSKAVHRLLKLRK